MAGLFDDAARPLQAAAKATAGDARDRVHRAIDQVFDKQEELEPLIAARNDVSDYLVLQQSVD